MSTPLQSKHHVHQTVPLLTVSDIQLATTFYCDGLGFEITQSWESGGNLAWCRIEHGGAALMLQQDCEEISPADQRGKGVTFYFICDDANTVFNEAKEKGIKASKPKAAFYGMNQTNITDPDGYALCFENSIESK